MCMRSLRALLLSLGLLLCAGQQAFAVTDMGNGNMRLTRDEARTLCWIYDPVLSTCLNPDSSWCGCMRFCLGDDTSGWYCVEGDEDDNCTDYQVNCDYSMVDNQRMAHMHQAVDWKAPRPNEAGCASCGSAKPEPEQCHLPGLTVGRIHRYRDIHRNGSFGPGVFSYFDQNLIVTQGTPTSNGTMRLWEPRALIEYVLGDSGATGTYNDTRLRIAGPVKLYKADGTITGDIRLAVKAVSISNSGMRSEFAMFRLSADVNSSERRGRITRIADRNGNAMVMNYAYPVTASDADLGYDRARLFQLSTVQDAYGRSAAFTYAASPIGGGYVVTRIDMPDGSQVNYAYGNPGLGLGQWDIVGLSGVSYPNGDAATFTTSLDTTAQLQTIHYDDPGAQDSHRRKDAWLTTDGFVKPDGSVASRSGRLIRMITDTSGEVRYCNWSGTVAAGSELAAFAMVGDQITYQYTGGHEVRAWISRGGFPVASAYSTNAQWVNNQVVASGWVKVESYVHNTQKRVYQKYDTLGRKTAWNVKTDNGAILGKTYPDNSSETWTRNGFRQPLTHKDQLGNQTVCTYDAAGNLLTRTKGVGSATPSTWSWTYNSRGQVVSASDADGHVTDYAYTPAGFLASIIEPADVAGGVRAVTQYTWDGAGRLIAITDAAGRSTSFLYDARNRLVRTTYADGSFEEKTYGSGLDANLVVAKRDRNGNIDSFGYDSMGRLISTIRYDAQSAVVARETCSYLAGTKVKTACVRDGDLTTYTTDDRNRVVATTRLPRLGAPLTSTTVFDPSGRVSASQDAYGRWTYLAYDVRNRVVRRVQELVPGGVPSGTNVATLVRVTTANPPYVIEEQAYDTANRLVARTDARQVQTTYAYDGQGRVVSQTEAAGTAIAATTSFSYDAQGNRLTVTNPRTYSTASTYTGRNLLKSVTEAVGTPVAATSSMTYTLTGKVATQTDALGRQTLYTYGTCCDRLAAITDPAGFITSFAYDFVGNRTSVTDPNGLTTLTTYDGRNRVKTVRNAANEQTTYTYVEDATTLPIPQINGLGLGLNADGSAVSVTNPLGQTSTEIRDGLGRVLRSIDANGNASTVAYDAVMGGLVESSQTDALGHVSRVRTDAAGRARLRIDQIGKAWYAGFDANGNQVSSTDPLGHGDSAVFDARNRRTSATDATNHVTAAAYDTNSNVISQTDALGQVTQFAFDPRDRKTSSTDRLGNVTSFAYDLVGNLLQITDAEGSVTKYGYDDRNLLTKETYPMGQQTGFPSGPNTDVRAYTYDAGRRLRTRLDQAAVTTTYGYDAANRLTSRAYSTGTSDTFAYDAAGRLIGANAGRYASTVNRAYDAAGRLSQETQTIGGETYPVAYGYDADNRQTALTHPDGSITGQTWTDRNQLLLVSLNAQAVALHGYDDAGRLAARTYGNGLNETRSYSDDNLVTAIQIPAVTSFAYTYDANHRKTSEIDSILAGANQTFAYDNENRLTTWQGGGNTQTWNLSAVGDWTKTVRNGSEEETRASSAVHETLSRTITDLSQNPVATAQKSLGYDAKGNLTADGEGQVFTWDEENRLLTAEIPNESGFGSKIATYAYDALGRRIQKSFNGISTRYVHDGARVVDEYESMYGVGDHLARSYVYGAYVDEVLAVQAAGNVIGGRKYLHANHLYSVAALTDHSGSVVERYSYTAFGAQTITSPTGAVRAKSAVGFDRAFTGQIRDIETNLNYARARMYSPSLGRFVSRDPNTDVREDGTPGYYIDGYSLYAGYFAPNGVDPSGMWNSDPSHEGLTSDSMDQLSKRFFPGGMPPGYKDCFDYIKGRITKANLGQDKGQALKENKRHYNRDIGANAATADADYGNYLNDEENNFNKSLSGSPPTCDECDAALDALGRLTHSWQDYYGHAVLLNGNAGPAWGAGITGSPDNRNPLLKPSSWGGVANSGEHGWVEPGNRDKGGAALRKQGAIDYVAGQLGSHLNEYWKKCRCCCPPPGKKK